MAHLAKLHPSPKNRTRLIWRDIAEYANADLASNKRAVGKIKMLIGNCLDWLGVPVDRLLDIDEIATYAREHHTTDETALRHWAIRYQPEFRKVLTWLCSPVAHSNLGTDAARLLHLHNEGLSLDIDFANDKFDETGNDGSPIFFFPALNSCESILSPICRFLVDHIWRFQEGDLPLRDAIPIRICARTGCNQFKLPERRKQTCFCSDRCRSASYQSKRPRGQKSAYMRQYRKTLASMSKIPLKPRVGASKKGSLGKQP